MPQCAGPTPQMIIAFPVVAETHASPPQRRLVGPRPSVSKNASAGLRPVPGAEHITVYNATTKSGKPNPFGTYNHGPIIIQYNSVYFMSWYNAPLDETLKKRSVF